MQFISFRTPANVDVRWAQRLAEHESRRARLDAARIERETNEKLRVFVSSHAEWSHVPPPTPPGVN